MQPKTYQTRIYYEDTDCGGIVYHANYLKYCERARSEWFFAQGILPQQNNIGFVVKNMNLDFLSPAKLGDLLTIHTEILEQKNASITLKQTILRESLSKQTQTKKPIFVAIITLVCFESTTQKITKIPQWAKDIYPMKLFQYGAITFPHGQKNLTDLWCYPIACKNVDGKNIHFSFYE